MLQYISLFGVEVRLYDLFNNLAMLAMCVFGLCQIKTYRQYSTLSAWVDAHLQGKPIHMEINRGSVAMMELILVVAAIGGSSYFLNRRMARWFDVGLSNFFGNVWAFPIATILVCALLRAKPLPTLDLLTPAQPLGLMLMKMACFCEGCCYGFACNSFYYSQFNERYEFPIQMVEVLCAAAMFIALLRMRKRPHRTGALYPAFMMMYGASRFLSEFLRDDWPAVLGPLTSYQLQCAVCALVGFAAWRVLKRAGQSPEVPQDAVHHGFDGLE